MPVDEETILSLRGLLLSQSQLENAYHPAIPLLGVYQKNMKTLVGKHVHPCIHCSIVYNSPDTEKT